MPPLEEQKRILEITDSLFALADYIERQTLGAASRIDALTQSILAKAFCGELIPQNPDDEPASVLLERIQAGRRTTNTGNEHHDNSLF